MDNGRDACDTSGEVREHRPVEELTRRVSELTLHSAVIFIIVGTHLFCRSDPLFPHGSLKFHLIQCHLISGFDV